MLLIFYFIRRHEERFWQSAVLILINEDVMKSRTVGHVWRRLLAIDGRHQSGGITLAGISQSNQEADSKLEL